MHVGKKGHRNMNGVHGCITQSPGLGIADGGPKCQRLQGKSTAVNALKDTKAPDKQEHWICNYVKKKSRTWARADAR